MGCSSGDESAVHLYLWRATSRNVTPRNLREDSTTRPLAARPRHARKDGDRSKRRPLDRDGRRRTIAAAADDGRRPRRRCAPARLPRPATPRASEKCAAGAPPAWRDVSGHTRAPFAASRPTRRRIARQVQGRQPHPLRRLRRGVPRAVRLRLPRRRRALEPDEHGGQERMERARALARVCQPHQRRRHPNVDRARARGMGGRQPRRPATHRGRAAERRAQGSEPVGPIGVFIRRRGTGAARGRRRR